jgi:hypothetical protein
MASIMPKRKHSARQKQVMVLSVKQKGKPAKRFQGSATQKLSE